MKKVKENKFSRLMNKEMVEKVEKHMLTSIRGGDLVQPNQCIATQDRNCHGNNLCTCTPPPPPQG